MHRIQTPFRRGLLTALVLTWAPVVALANTPITQIKSLANNVKAVSNTETDTLVIEGQEGIQQAPLPSSTVLALEDDWYATGRDPEATYFVNPEAAEAIERSLSTGILDPMLEPYLEPLDGEGDLPVPTLKGSCSDQIKTKTKNVSLNFNNYNTQSNMGPFTGTFNIDADITGSASVIFKYRVKRTKVLWWCVPHWVKFEDVRAYGNANVGGDLGLDGSISNINNPWTWEKELAKPHLGNLDFFVGPVWVRLGFKLPITAGLRFGVSASANLDYSTDGNASGSFDYTCTFNGCNGSSNFSSSFTPGSGSTLYSISGRADLTAWLQVAVRTYLYSESVAYAQVGVRPKLYGDLWGYYGNNCGDRDDNGSNETVDALTLDLDWQIFVTAQASALGGGPWKWDDLWHSSRWHITFWDIIGSDAIKPELHGPSTALLGSSTTYQARMGSCWPYSDSVNYNLNWGDGSSTSFSNAPDVWKSRSKAWSSTGNKNVRLRAISDAHGRTFNKDTYRTVNVTGSGGGGGGGGGGGTGSAPLAQLLCSTDSESMSCTGIGSGGRTPYTYYWRQDSGSWYVGSATRLFICGGLENPYLKAPPIETGEVQFKIKGGDGQWSNIVTRYCGGPIP